MEKEGKLAQVLQMSNFNYSTYASFSDSNENWEKSM